MTRSTRGVVDDSRIWNFRNIVFVDPENTDAEPAPAEQDYFVVSTGFSIYSDTKTSYNSVVFWGVGIVSFGPVTQAQTQFMANLTSHSEMTGFPGDFIAVGFSDAQWSALEYGKKADYVYFTSHSDPYTSGGAGFATVVITPDEIVLSGSAMEGADVGLRIGAYEVSGAKTIFLADLNPIAGTSGCDEIIGSDAPEAINGRGGDDHLVGGAGGDRLTGGSGKDHLEGGSGNDRITGDNGHDRLSGGDGNDRLDGGSGNDVLAPGTGTDFVNGGDGNDRLQLDLSQALGSLTVNFASSGLIRTPGVGVVEYSNMEMVDIQGGGYIDFLTGGAGDDQLFGNGGFDFLSGGDGNDLLDGGGFAGALVGDLPAGGTSLGTALQVVPYFTTAFADDILNSTTIPHVTASLNLQGSGDVFAEQYLAISVTAGATVVIDLDNSGDGFNYQVDQMIDILDDDLAATHLSGTFEDGWDAEEESLTYTFVDAGTYYLKLSGYIRNETAFRQDETLKFHVSLSSAVPLEGDHLVGGAGKDTLIGGEGNDVLDGGIGNDVMTGGLGNDTYIVDDVRDRVNENSASLGTGDLVLSSISFKLGLNVENLTLTGNLDTNGTGNSLANTIAGNGGANMINGGDGRDVLSGGGGADRFLFNTALSAANRDDILDFSVIDDTIALDRSIFQKISGNGALAASAFVVGTAAEDARDRIIYDRAAGDIYYDRDGTGKAAQVLFAHVDAGTQLTHWDFLMV